MQFNSAKWGMVGIAIWSALINTGCASGGFKLTRQYASFVNQNHVIVRVILYILTSIVFAVTLLIDAVIYNTMDFWQGRVSQGDYQFKDGARTYFVRHSQSPSTGLRESLIEVRSVKTDSKEFCLSVRHQVGKLNFESMECCKRESQTLTLYRC